MPMPSVMLAADTSPEGRARRDRNVATIDTFFAHLRAGDVDAWIDLWAENGRVLVPYPPEGAGFPPSIEGRDQILAGFRQLFAIITRFDADVHTVYPTLDPDVIVVEWTVTQDLATGQTYTGDNITIFQFTDGKIAVYHDYFNPERFRTVVEATSA